MVLDSSNIKVGITRHTQIPTRWMDQGAIQALPILKVASGLVEIQIKQHVSDRTSWQKMLKNQVEEVDLKQKADELLNTCKDGISEIEQQFGENSIDILNAPNAVSIQYPVFEYPIKVKSLNLDKTPEITGALLGIKGQYLIFDIGVINIRKYGGYRIEVSF